MRIKLALLCVLSVAMPVWGQSSVQPKGAAIHVNEKTRLDSQSATATPHLDYFGGPVISNVQIVVVYWGPNVSPIVQAGMPDFYRGVTNSAYLDLLSEFSTNLPSGTNQSIGRGSFLTAMAINPSVTGTTVSGVQIEAELIRQINGGYLPQPRYDLAGNIVTEYMIYFPPGIVITKPNDASCTVGGFCGYHSTALFNGKFLAYGVFPDFGPGSGCDVLCGYETQFQNLTKISSHELAESITDPAVGQVQSYGSPLGWYDRGDNEEIGDLCYTQQVDLPTPTGAYSVQPEFSNYYGACVASGLHPNFVLSTPPPTTRGVPVNLNLTAMNPMPAQGTDTSFVGTVHFTSTDKNAVLPQDYTFTPLDHGVHTFTVTLKSSGTQTITAADTVNGAVRASSAVAELSDFSVVVIPHSFSMRTGLSGTVTVYTNVVSGSSEPVTLTANGLPSGASASFSPAVVASGQSSVMTINSGTALTGSYQFTVTGSSGGVQRTDTMSLVIFDQTRSGSLTTNDSADRLSWTYQPNALNMPFVEFQICKVPSITWWKEFLIRSGNFVIADMGVKDSATCASRLVSWSTVQQGLQMELWKAKFLGIPAQVKVMPSDFFGYLAPGSRITVTWTKD